ncbi:hypothetical protein BpHYR1_051706 [Brachionus plicatilis]|uniref:Uncharacterized protein n=1 Tax=Brachionus plicatilis TaxID=10195 RepID=A0A3M7SI80_BRAPC|nr:hypothetical protein BpHYR1_051706 [Brachionus plicatilis]
MSKKHKLKIHQIKKVNQIVDFNLRFLFDILVLVNIMIILIGNTRSTDYMHKNIISISNK